MRVECVFCEEAKKLINSMWLKFMLEVIKQRMRKVEFKTECRFVVINNRMSFYPRRHQQQDVILPSS